MSCSNVVIPRLEPQASLCRRLMQEEGGQPASSAGGVGACAAAVDQRTRGLVQAGYCLATLVQLNH